MWRGVDNGFASFEFSVSPIISGFCVVNLIRIIIVTITGVESFTEKYGWNLILSKFGFVPVGLEDPLLCSINR